MLERLRRMFEHYRDLTEVSSLSDRELADLGVSRDQALQLAALPDDVPGRVAAMGRIFGISETDLTRDRAVWQELLAVCQSCRELRSCRRLMERADTAAPADAGFCPNWTQFAEFDRAH
jgi:hypothetical protein